MKLKKETNPNVHPFHIFGALKREGKPMTFQVSKLTKKKLNQLCATTHRNKNQILEALINNAYKNLNETITQKKIVLYELRQQPPLWCEPILEELLIK